MIYHLLPEWEVFSAYRGGALAHIAAAVMRFDSSAMVVCPHADETCGFAQERILSIPELRLYAKLKGRFFYPLWLTAPFFRHFLRPLLSRVKDGDIVWCHSQPYLAAALEAGIHAKGAKLIYHSASPLTIYPSLSLFQAFSADAYIFTSEAMRQEALRLIPALRNAYAIHNGADETLFYPAAPTKRPRNVVPVILYVGRLHPEKGVHVLIAAMRILQERKVAAVCKVVGSSFSGGSKPTAYAKGLAKDRPSNVEFKEFRIQTGLAEEYRSADILCCPSIFQEPFGSVNIEGMACGIPVVASRVGGIPEIAAAGGVILVEPDSAVELADALQKLIEDQGLRARVAEEGLSSFRQRFTWPSIVKQYQGVSDALFPQLAGATR
jgi:spore coat protein SA